MEDVSVSEPTVLLIRWKRPQEYSDGQVGHPVTYDYVTMKRLLVVG